MLVQWTCRITWYTSAINYRSCDLCRNGIRIHVIVNIIVWGFWWYLNMPWVFIMHVGVFLCCGMPFCDVETCRHILNQWNMMWHHACNIFIGVDSQTGCWVNCAAGRAWRDVVHVLTGNNLVDVCNAQWLDPAWLGAGVIVLWWLTDLQYAKHWSEYIIGTW